MDQADIPALLSRLASDEDASRKMAVFKLQSSINDPAFADVFISSGGLVVLRRLIMNSTGNTLAYSLQSLTRLLEVDMGWDIFEGPTASELVERVVELIVKNPLVNILRGAMSILVSLVGHSQSATGRGGGSTRTPGTFGFRALRPAVAVYPHFLELVIQQLQSADHSLCANALMLINALIRDALSNDNQNDTSSTRTEGLGAGEDWSTLIKRLYELGLIGAVYNIMRSSALQDLAHPMLEFQALTKVLLGKWRSVKVDVEKSEHRRALKSLHLASAPDRVNGHSKEDSGSGPGRKASRKHSPEKWRRLGFESESPGHEFGTAGYLGLMDMSDYVRRYEDGFQKLLLEQAAKPLQERLPFAQASLAITMVLYGHFEVDRTDLEDTRGYQGVDMSDHDRIFQPLILQWTRLHAAGLHAFFRLWNATGAQRSDFDKVTELVRILIEQVVGQATRAKDVMEAEDEMQEYDVKQLRELQMGLLGLAFEDQWGQHLKQMRDELKQEALQFVKEQRIRCLLQGSWFMRPQAKGVLWRFARLSHNRRFLHYADFEHQTVHDPALGTLTDKVDLNMVSSVVSNVSAPNEDSRSIMSGATVKNANANAGGGGGKGTTKITVYRFANQSESLVKGGGGKEQAMLTLWPPTHSLASEWLDGLLMLLKQAPITAETNKLVNMVSEYGLKIRLLNVRMDSAFEGPPPGAGAVPSRKGLDEDYFFEI